MILELLKYAKSAIRNFDQSEASIMVMWLPITDLLRALWNFAKVSWQLYYLLPVSSLSCGGGAFLVIVVVLTLVLGPPLLLLEASLGQVTNTVLVVAVVDWR